MNDEDPYGFSTNGIVPMPVVTTRYDHLQQYELMYINKEKSVWNEIENIINSRRLSNTEKKNEIAQQLKNYPMLSKRRIDSNFTITRRKLMRIDNYECVEACYPMMNKIIIIAQWSVVCIDYRGAVLWRIPFRMIVNEYVQLSVLYCQGTRQLCITSYSFDNAFSHLHIDDRDGSIKNKDNCGMHSNYKPFELFSISRDDDNKLASSLSNSRSMCIYMNFHFPPHPRVLNFLNISSDEDSFKVIDAKVLF